MLATSLGPLDVAIGEIGWALIRGGLYAAGFLVVMAVMGLTASWWAVLLLPAALLIAFGFGAVGMAVTSYMKSVPGPRPRRSSAVLPMFLFSGTFYALSVYPRVAADRRRVPAAAPRHRDAARAQRRRARLGAGSGTRCTSSRWPPSG